MTVVIGVTGERYNIVCMRSIYKKNPRADGVALRSGLLQKLSPHLTKKFRRLLRDRATRDTNKAEI